MQESTNKTEDKPQILCVDDEPNILSALKRTFRPQGFQVHTASSGQKALELLEENPVNLVISDMRMPEMDGAEFLSRVHQQWPDIGRILLTGYADLDSTVKALNEGGISSYVSKPWDDNDLTHKVKAVLRIHFLEKERDHLMHVTHHQNKKLVSLNRNLEKRVEDRTAELKQTADMLDTAYQELSDSYDLLVKILSTVAYSRKELYGTQMLKLAQLTLRFVKQLKLNDYERKQVYYASMLFQLGKVGMPESLLRKPLADMNAEEQASYYQYPVIGEAVLMSVSFLQEAREIIRFHCEYIDGSGASGLTGNEIPVGAKILAIVKDYFYLQWSVANGIEYTAQDAREYLYKYRGVKYDAELLDKFNLIAQEFEEETKVSKETCLSGQQIKPGMILSRDCLNKRGWLLLTRGTELTDEQISRLASLEKMQETPLNIFVEQKG